MNLELLYNGLIQMGISILVGIIILYTTYKLVDKYIQKKYEMGNDNIAYAILCSSILFSVGYLFNGLNKIITDSIELIENQINFNGSIFLEGLKYSGVFIGISSLIIAIVIIISINLFILMTKEIDEFKEIKNNNIAVSIITSVIMISISLMIKDSLYLILDSIIPYPVIPNLN
jgi:hypothetical protein|tara:strand:- start:3824 stop:4345 length:522 start_codon:yes stop_codon:yes gene_type:complete